MAELPSIFVFGLFPDSSGKTILACALARGLANSGLRVGVFKPRSGHNIWYQYGAFLKCKDADSLFCEDIIKLRDASRCDMPYEVLNPVDALLAPLNAEYFLKRNTSSQMFLFEHDIFRHLIVERHSILKLEGTETFLLINERNIDANLAVLDRSYVEGLRRAAAKVISVRSLDE